jgi:hypothetical protein
MLNTDEILVRSGDRLMEAPIFAGGGIEGIYGLFKACNFISSLTYERATSIGEMLIARKDHPNIQAEHRFYISQSLCEKANRIREARKKIWDEGKVNFFFEIKPFEPHPAMSDDYLEE